MKGILIVNNKMKKKRRNYKMKKNIFLSVYVFYILIFIFISLVSISIYNFNNPNPIPDNATHSYQEKTMWLKVIEKQIYPRFSNGFTYQWATLFVTEDNELITSVEWDTFNLLNVHEIINAKVKYIKTYRSVKLYRIRDIVHKNQNVELF
jgi:hypothetical protein